MENSVTQSQVRDKSNNTEKLNKSGKKTPLINENQKSIVSPNPRSKSNPRKKSSERSNDTSTDISAVGEESDKKKMSTKNQRNVPNKAKQNTKISKQEQKALQSLKKETKPAKRGFFSRRKKDETVKGSTTVSTVPTLRNTKAPNVAAKKDFEEDINELDGGLLSYSEPATPRDSVQSTFLKKSRHTMTKSLMMDINIFNYLKEEKGNLGPDEEEPPLPDRTHKPRVADSMNDFTGLDQRLYDGGNVYRNTTANLDAKLDIKKQVESRRARGIGGAFRSVGKGLGRFASFMNPRKRIKGAGSVLGRLSFRGSLNFRSSWGGSSYEDGNDIRGVLGNEPEKKREDDEITDLSVDSDELGDLLTVSKKKKKEPTVPSTSAAAVAARNSLQKSEGGDHHQDRKVTDITEKHDQEEDLDEGNVKYADMRMSSTHIDTWEESDEGEDGGKEETDDREPGDKKNSFLGSAMTKSSSMLARVPLSGDSDDNIREESKLNSNQNFKMFTIQGKQPQANDKVKVVNTGRKSLLSAGRLSKEMLDEYEDDAIRDEEGGSALYV